MTIPVYSCLIFSPGRLIVSVGCSDIPPDLRLRCQGRQANVKIPPYSFGFAPVVGLQRAERQVQLLN